MKQVVSGFAVAISHVHSIRKKVKEAIVSDDDFMGKLDVVDLRLLQLEQLLTKQSLHATTVSMDARVEELEVKIKTCIQKGGKDEANA